MSDPLNPNLRIYSLRKWAEVYGFHIKHALSSLSSSLSMLETFQHRQEQDSLESIFSSLRRRDSYLVDTNQKWYEKLQSLYQEGAPPDLTPESIKTGFNACHKIGHHLEYIEKDLAIFYKYEDLAMIELLRKRIRKVYDEIARMDSVMNPRDDLTY